MNIGFWQVLIVAVLVILLFGRGKISDLMGDVASGIKSFRKGMAEDELAARDPNTIEGTAEAASTPEDKKDEAVSS